MQAIFLTAGENSRMFPLDKITHKGLLSVHGKPLIEYAMNKLIEIGIDEFVIVLGEYGYVNEIKEYFSTMNYNIKFTTQKSATGQGDAILTTEKYIDGDFVIVDPYYLGDDNILSKMVEKFKNEDLDGLVGGKEEENISDYGAFDLTEDERINNYIEKPKPGEAPSNIKKTSIEIYKNSYFDYIKSSLDAQYPNIEAMIKLARDGNVKVYNIDKNIFSTTLKYCWDFLKIVNFINDKFRDELVENSFVDKSAVVDGVELINSNIEKDVQIGEGSKIENSIIMKGTHLGKNSFVKNSIIGPNCIIGEGFMTEMSFSAEVFAEVKAKKMKVKVDYFGTAISKNVKIGDNVIVKPGILIGMNNEISDETHITNNLNHKND